eukprot:TRINITY_DN31519_c0_g2_i2.p1 TRINITY_DN31519_c0_g2~~TRINITY_DN31519_c0_g2_i2.p1  ORF type:complete len:312 (-),score=11.65 TRINITY_DN31519_c0_g2_i2:115-921(-)
MGHHLNDVMKPDLVAPGVEIWAGWTQSPRQTTDLGVTDGISVAPSAVSVQMVSGTSMSTPHIAGIAALVMQRHPNWSPFAVKSALLTTAYTTNSAKNPIATDDGTPANGFYMGSGHVFPKRALDPGLVYDNTFVRMVQFLMSIDAWAANQTEAFQSLPKRLRQPIPTYNLNLPNIAVSRLRRSAVVWRTVRNVGEKTAVYRAYVAPPRGVRVSVTPPRFIIKPGQSISYSVKFTVQKTSRNFQFGSLVWSDGTHFVRSVLTVQPLKKV